MKQREPEEPPLEVLARCEVAVRNAGKRLGTVAIPLADLKALLHPWRLARKKPSGPPGSTAHALLYEALVGFTLLHAGPAGMEMLMQRRRIPPGIAKRVATHFRCSERTVTRLVRDLDERLGSIDAEIESLRSQSAHSSNPIKRIFQIRALEVERARLTQLRDAPRALFVEPTE